MMTVCIRLLQSKLVQSEQRVPTKVPNCILLLIGGLIAALLSANFWLLLLIIHHLLNNTETYCDVFQYGQDLGWELDRRQQYDLYCLADFFDYFFHLFKSNL